MEGTGSVSCLSITAAGAVVTPRMGETVNVEILWEGDTGFYRG